MNTSKKIEQKSEETDSHTINGRTITNTPNTIMNKKVVGVILLVLVVVIGAALYTKSGLMRNSNTYQAVFLNNGQVYFGKLSDQDSLYPTLHDVFYLQITQPPQPLRQGETPPTNANLVKLGGELHGPTDEMRINREQILFIEDLRPDSRVVQAILQFKKGGQ